MAFKSRTQRRADQNLGVISPHGKISLEFRSKKLRKYEDYFYNRQHDGKTPWHEAEADQSQYVPINQRKPTIVFPLAEVITSRIASKLFGEDVFPKFMVEDDLEASAALQNMVRGLKLKSYCLDFTKLALALGSVFVRIKVLDEHLSLEHYSSNVCYPEFGADGELEALRVQYVYEDSTKVDEESQEPKKYWFSFLLTKKEDILYNNPEYKEGQPPEFKVVSKVEHDLGHVQGEWLKLTSDDLAIDGESKIKNILDLADSISYNLSMSDRATLYGIDPQLILRGMESSELEELIKSKEKSWTLGREGEASFLEIDGAGVVNAGEVELRLQRKAQEITKAIMHDPEKIIGAAQSGKAMEILNAPLLELITELRPMFGEFLQKLTKKILIMSRDMEVKNAAKWKVPESLDIEELDLNLEWGEIFPPTVQDLGQLAAFYVQLTNGNILSRETALRKLAPYIGIEDVDEEVKKIASQPQLGEMFGGAY